MKQSNSTCVKHGLTCRSLSWMSLNFHWLIKSVMYSFTCCICKNQQQTKIQNKQRNNPSELSLSRCRVHGLSCPLTRLSSNRPLHRNQSRLSFFMTFSHPSFSSAHPSPLLPSVSHHSVHLLLSVCWLMWTMRTGGWKEKHSLFFFSVSTETVWSLCYLTTRKQCHIFTLIKVEEAGFSFLPSAVGNFLQA